LALIENLVIAPAHPLAQRHHRNLLAQFTLPARFVEQNRDRLRNIEQIEELLDVHHTNVLEDYHAGIENAFSPLLDDILRNDLSLRFPPQVGGCPAGYVRDAELFKDHAGTGLLQRQLCAHAAGPGKVQRHSLPGLISPTGDWHEPRCLGILHEPVLCLLGLDLCSCILRAPHLCSGILHNLCSGVLHGPDLCTRILHGPDLCTRISNRPDMSLLLHGPDLCSGILHDLCLGILYGLCLGILYGL
jgi:hypothetical protein